MYLNKLQACLLGLSIMIITALSVTISMLYGVKLLLRDNTEYEFYDNAVFHNQSIRINDFVSNVKENNVLIIYSQNVNFPRIRDLGNNSYEFDNGGIPQLMNYNLFEESLLSFLKSSKTQFPSPKFIIFDMEDWTPIWKNINDIYKNTTIEFVNTTCTQYLDSSDLIHRSKQSWQESSMDLMIKAMDIARHSYPNSSIGYYGYPNMPYWTNSSITRQASYDNDQMISLWQQVDVLLPSIYVPYITDDIKTFHNNLRYIKRKIKESARIRDNLIDSGFDPIPIIPYTWYKYHSGQPILNEIDTFLEFFYPHYFGDEGVDGVIIWGVEGNDDGDKNASEYFKEYAGRFEKFKEDFRLYYTRHRRYLDISFNNKSHNLCLENQLSLVLKNNSLTKNMSKYNRCIFDIPY